VKRRGTRKHPSPPVEPVAVEVDTSPASEAVEVRVANEQLTLL